MSAKPESISAACTTVSPARKRAAKRDATRARRRAERRDPESAAARYVRGYAD